jgi:hypothetical protein
MPQFHGCLLTASLHMALEGGVFKPDIVSISFDFVVAGTQNSA